MSGDSADLCEDLVGAARQEIVGERDPEPFGRLRRPRQLPAHGLRAVDGADEGTQHELVDAPLRPASRRLAAKPAIGTWQPPSRACMRLRSARTASVVRSWINGVTSPATRASPALASMASEPCPTAGNI